MYEATDSFRAYVFVKKVKVLGNDRLETLWRTREFETGFSNREYLDLVRIYPRLRSKELRRNRLDSSGKERTNLWDGKSDSARASGGAVG